METLDDLSSIGHLPHEESASVVVAALGSDLQAGLTSQEAEKRQNLYGLNTLRPKAHVPAWKRLLAQFHDPQVYLLLVAAAVTIVVAKLEGEFGISYEALIILTIVVLNAALGFVQEDRAERALASLEQMMPKQLPWFTMGTTTSVGSRPRPGRSSDAA